LLEPEMAADSATPKEALAASPEAPLGDKTGKYSCCFLSVSFRPSGYYNRFP
jgi:hypothetical protein